MTKPVFISAAFNDHRYFDQLKRLERSIKEIYPDAETMFWTRDIPGKPFLESLYGFKVHCIQAAIDKGFQKVIWIDPACILMKPVEYYFESELPVIAVKDDSLLKDSISDKALAYYGNPDITGWHLVGGSLYVFDFDYIVASLVFDHWARAEQDGIFGSQEEASTEQINKHRYDEACFSVALYENGLEPVSHETARYNYEGAIFVKKHFK